MTEVTAILRWSVSLGIKFFRVAPVLTVSIVILSLVAQIASLLSFFLPLKIIILLGSEGMPQYFPPSLTQLGKDHLIAVLSGATLLFYLISLIAEKFIARSTEVASGRLLELNEKLVLFENQEDVATKAFQRYSRALAAGVFIPLALVVLAWFYFSMAGLIAGYMILVSLLSMYAYRVSEKFRDYWDRKLESGLSLAENMGFFVVFSYLVMEFIFYSPPGFVIAVVSLLASRQIFGRAKTLISGLHGLAQQRPRLDALFFHGKVLVSQQSRSRRNSVWTFLQPESRSAWLPRLMQDAGMHAGCATNVEVRWLDSSKPNIPNLLVFNSGAPEQALLVKVFDVNCKSQSQHEVMLASEGLEQVPIPPLILETFVGEFTCHVYRLPAGNLLKPRQARTLLPELEKRFMLVSLHPRLVHRYVRSLPLLMERLSAEVLSRLYVACGSEDEYLYVERLLHLLTELHSCLKTLPLVLLNPAMTRSVWQEGGSNTLLAVNWGKWSLDPLGSGWPLAEKPFLRHMRELAGETNCLLSEADPQSVRLATLAYGLEDFIKQQQLNDALSLIPEMLDLLDKSRG